MIYTFGIYLYGFAIRIASLFSKKAQLWVEGRKNYWSTLPDVSQKKVVWFHCASLGEYDQGKPIMEEWKKRHPEYFILVTFFSPSGYLNVKDKSIGDFTCYLPLDTPKNAGRFIRHFQPYKTFFIKYEIWINFIRKAYDAGSELYLISAVFRGTQHFFKWYGWSFRKALKKFDHLFVQYEFNHSLLYSIGIENVTTSGDTRYDRVMMRANLPQKNTILEKWLAGKKAFVMGSSWPKGEELIIPFINDDTVEEPVLIAPHEVNEEHIQQIIGQLRVNYQRYTHIKEGEKVDPTAKVIVLDCIGVLAEAYYYGQLAYVGGGFGTGLHNILEPAAYGLPVIFGPYYQKFLEAQEFIDSGIGQSCGGSNGFKQAYIYLKQDRSLNDKIHQFMQSKVGATKVIMDYVDKES